MRSDGAVYLSHTAPCAHMDIASRLAEENERLWQALNVLYIESLHFADNRIGEQCLRDAIKAAHDILMKSNKEHNAALAREEINR